MSDSPNELHPQVPGFEILEEVGRGATSRVYRACQIALDREVALKIITTLGEEGQRRAVRLFREARLAGALDHPGIVRGIDAGEADGFCWFAMDLVDGESLQELLDRQARLPLSEVLSLAESLLEAVNHAHRRGVTHRDIKPANILMDVDGLPRILDLGLARRHADPAVTGEGAVGTPQYMAPEHARDPRKVDGRSDLFSLGATLYRALCGVAPFDGASVGQVLTNVLHVEAERPSTRVRGLPQAVDLVMQRLLEKRPEHRYQSATEVLADVRALRQGRPPSARRRIPRGRSLAVAGALVVMLCGWGALHAFRAPQLPGPAVTPDPVGEGGPLEKGLGELERIASDTESNIGDRVQRALQHRERRPGAEADALVASLDRAYFAAVARRIEAVEQYAQEAIAAGDPGAVALSDLEARVRNKVFRVGAASYDDRVRALCRQAMGRVARQVSEGSEAVVAALLVSMDDWLAENSGRLLADSVVVIALDAIENEGGPVALLTAAQRADIRDKRESVRRALSGHPQREWENAVLDVNNHIEDLRLVSARRTLDRACARIGELVPTAHAEAAGLKRLIVIKRDEMLDSAKAIRDLARRHELDGMALEERRRRLESIRGAIARHHAPSEIPGLEAELQSASHLLRSLEHAVGLRDDVLRCAEALASGTGTRFRPRVRHKGYVPFRVFLGRAGRLLRARDAVGVTRIYGIDDLLAPCVMDLAEAAGLAPHAATGAWLAYLDGDDDLALELATSLDEDDATRATLLRFSRDGVNRRLATFDVAADRTAYGRLVTARACVAAGDVSGAGEALDVAERGLRRGKKGWATRRFWREFGAEIRTIRTELEELASLEAGWGGFGKHLRADIEARRIVLSLPLGTRTSGVKGIRLPPRAVAASDGIRLIGSDHLARTPPHHLPPVHIALPALSAAIIDLRFHVVFESGPFPPAFLAVALHDVTFAMFDTTLDGGPFRASPLHGLERGLHAPRRIAQAGAWVGPLADYGSRTGPPKAEIRFPRDKPVSVRLSCGVGGRDLKVRVGDGLVFRLQGSRRPSLTEGGLRITGFPTVRVSDLRLDVRWDRPDK